MEDSSKKLSEQLLFKAKNAYDDGAEGTAQKARDYAEGYKAFLDAAKTEREAVKRGGLTPAALNGANEQAVALFLQGKIGFLEIAQRVASVLERTWGEASSVEDVLRCDREAREYVRKGGSV